MWKPDSAKPLNEFGPAAANRKWKAMVDQMFYCFSQRRWLTRFCCGWSRVACLGRAVAEDVAVDYCSSLLVSSWTSTGCRRGGFDDLLRGRGCRSLAARETERWIADTGEGADFGYCGYRPSGSSSAKSGFYEESVPPERFG